MKNLLIAAAGNWWLALATCWKVRFAAHTEFYFNLSLQMCLFFTSYIHFFIL